MTSVLTALEMNCFAPARNAAVASRRCSEADTAMMTTLGNFRRMVSIASVPLIPGKEKSSRTRRNSGSASATRKPSPAELAARTLASDRIVRSNCARASR